METDKCESCGLTLSICDCFGAGLDIIRYADLMVKDIEILEADGFSAIMDGDMKTVKLHFEGC